MDEILRVEHLKRYFVTKKGMFGSTMSTTKAVDDVSFSVERGEVFVIAGESGSGKSTIAKVILGSTQRDSGTIFFDGHEVKTDQKSMQRIRMGCQMIHQDPYDSINPRMRIADIISEPLEIHGIGSKKERADRVTEVLREVRLEPLEEIATKHPHMLSGGQRQRVVLARALAPRPKIIIADEPVSMLDVSIRAEILELMRQLQIRHNISFVYITHDLATARYFGQRVGILYRGRIVEMGKTSDVLSCPRHPYTQALTDATSIPDPDNLHKEKRIRIVEHIKGADITSDDDRTVLLPSVDGCRFALRCPFVVEECIKEPDLKEIRPHHHAACHVDLDNIRSMDV